MVDLIEKRHVGKFRISRYLLNNSSSAEMLRLMGHFIIVRAEHRFTGDFLEYEGYSPLFDSILEYEIIPEYHILVTSTGKIVAERVQ